MNKAGYLESASFFSLRNLSVKRLSMAEKIYIAQLFKAHAICDIIGKQVKQYYWKSTVYIRYRFNRLNRAVNITDTAFFRS